MGGCFEIPSRGNTWCQWLLPVLLAASDQASLARLISSSQHSNSNTQRSRSKYLKHRSQYLFKYRVGKPVLVASREDMVQLSNQRSGFHVV